jgi:hypothetical protein
VEAQACALNASLEAALLRELQQAYRQIDASLFRNSLRPVVLELSSAQSFLGRWHAASRTIEIARSFAVHHPWTSVLEVLKHEMAHQYVDEVLGEPNAGHGAAFRDVCARFRIDPRASGVPDSRTPGADEERVLARVARLLALADSPNENEAHAAMSAAQRLMLRYNIDQAAAASQDRRYGFRQVGRITGRIQESERLLGALLVDHFFVDAIWVPAYEPSTGRSGSVLEICGTPANLEMADYVHAFLTHTAQHSWEAHQKAARTTSNRDRQTSKVIFEPATRTSATCGTRAIAGRRHGSTASKPVGTSSCGGPSMRRSATGDGFFLPGRADGYASPCSRKQAT